MSRVDPWSVMKTSFLFSIAFGIMLWVATYVLWTVIVGVRSVRGGQRRDREHLISSPDEHEPWRIEDYINTNKVLGITALVAVINVVIMTALGTLCRRSCTTCARTSSAAWSSPSPRTEASGACGRRMRG